jgi:predicted GNAT family N-acyltransferase
MTYLAELLNSEHIKDPFDCGNQLLSQYLHKQAKQDVKRKLAACFVIVSPENIVKGYYTLSNAGIDRDMLPPEISKKLPPSYHSLPVTLLGRLARDVNFNDERLGETLLMDALKRSYDTSMSIGSMAVVVDPIDEAAHKFYLRYGFIDLPDSGKMFLSMKTIAGLFGDHL